jgi:sigma-B regulation protein RsbU (phosphoserine phosphatase)
VSQVINKLDGSNFDEEDKETLALLCANAGIAIENARLHHEILRKQQIEKDLAFATSIQLSFLPSEMPRLSGFAFSAQYQAAQEIGGDFYDFIPLDDNRIGILIGDVSGKGVAAALFMAKFTTDFRLLAIREEDPKAAGPKPDLALSNAAPERLMRRVNELVCAQSCRGMFVSLLYMVLKKNSGEAVYVNAGHLPPVIWNSLDGKYALLRGSGGPPLGIVPDQCYASQTMSITRGDCIVLATDGLIEAKDGQGNRFGWDRLEECVRSGGSDIESVRSRISSCLSRFVGECPQADDTTVVLAGFEEER